MKRWMMVLAGLLFAGVVMATDSVRFGSRVVTVGDSESKVLQVAGEPARRVTLENKYGATTGYRLDYANGRSTVQIYIRDGRVVDIEEIYD